MGGTFYCPNCGASITEESETRFDAMGNRVCKHCHRLIPADQAELLAGIQRMENNLARRFPTRHDIEQRLGEFGTTMLKEIDKKLERQLWNWPKLTLFKERHIAAGFCIFVTVFTALTWAWLVLNHMFTVPNIVASLVIWLTFWGIIFKAIDYAY